MAFDPNSVSVCSYKLGADQYLDIFALLPNKNLSSFYISVGIIFFLTFFGLSVFRRWTDDPRAIRGVEILSALSILFVAFWSYVTLYNNLDEVAVNLEHSFNLLHFGRFSMTPTKIVDGTVEHLYYLLLTPFAQNAPTLVLANFILGFIIICAHLLLFKRIAQAINANFAWPVFGLFVAVYYPFISVSANGFGNSLMSLVILFAIYNAVRKHVDMAWISASVLSLIRPDGVLYSASLGLSLYCAQYISRKKLAYCVTLTATILGAYLFGHKAYFGHAIPTPILFKSIPLSTLSIESLLNVWPFIVANFALLFFIFRFRKRWSSSIDRLGLLLITTFLPIRIWFAVSNEAHASYLGDSFSRYWIGFETALLFMFLLIALRMPRYVSYVGLIIIACCLSFKLRPSSWVRSWANRNDLAMAGEIVDRITPDSFRIASTEMNGFGLGIIEKDVIDLWGYSNPEIAASDMCNQYQQKVSPGIFERTDPDIFFIYSLIPTQKPLEKLLQYDHFIPERSLIGDLRTAFKGRSILAFELPGNNRFSLLVSNRHVEELKVALHSKLNVSSETCGAFSLSELDERYTFGEKGPTYRKCSEVSLEAVRAKRPATTF